MNETEKTLIRLTAAINLFKDIVMYDDTILKHEGKVAYRKLKKYVNKIESSFAQNSTEEEKQNRKNLEEYYTRAMLNADEALERALGEVEGNG